MMRHIVQFLVNVRNALGIVSVRVAFEVVTSDAADESFTCARSTAKRREEARTRRS